MLEYAKCKKEILDKLVVYDYFCLPISSTYSVEVIHKTLIAYRSKYPERISYQLYFFL